MRASASASSALEASTIVLTSSKSEPTQIPATGMASGRIVRRNLLAVLGGILLCSAVSWPRVVEMRILRYSIRFGD